MSQISLLNHKFLEDSKNNLEIKWKKEEDIRSQNYCQSTPQIIMWNCYLRCQANESQARVKTL